MNGIVAMKRFWRAFFKQNSKFKLNLLIHQTDFRKYTPLDTFVIDLRSHLVCFGHA